MKDFVQRNWVSRSVHVLLSVFASPAMICEPVAFTPFTLYYGDQNSCPVFVGSHLGKVFCPGRKRLVVLSWLTDSRLFPLSWDKISSLLPG